MGRPLRLAFGRRFEIGSLWLVQPDGRSDREDPGGSSIDTGFGSPRAETSLPEWPCTRPGRGRPRSVAQIERPVQQYEDEHQYEQSGERAEGDGPAREVGEQTDDDGAERTED